MNGIDLMIEKMYFGWILGCICNYFYLFEIKDVKEMFYEFILREKVVF